MRVRGYTELTTTELPDELQFRVVRHAILRAWINWVTKRFLSIAPALALCLLYGFWKDRSVLWAFAGLLTGVFSISVVMFLAHWLHGPTTDLCVTGDELVANGNLRTNILSNRATVPWSEVKILGWAEEGLCVVRKGFWGLTTCVLPGLDEEQAKAVRTAISMRFPGIAFKVRPGTAVSDIAGSYRDNPDTNR
ncbi:MAG: hypothetical protein ABSC48_14140 [Terracidiphilus sp.]|jgi:hypothetical protein